MTTKIIFGLLGGLGLFIYGMKLMGDGLEKAAGEKLKKVLEVLTSNSFKAILVGAGVTAIIQSSSATTVMTVGFVNAGLLNLFQAAGIIMGANIGTTMTAQLIAFNLNDIAPLILAIGSAIVIFSKKKRTKDIGEIVLGFGILFVGMSMMETSMSPIREMGSFKDLILRLGKYPVLGILVGFGMTATVQSSSATIGILMALASNNGISLGVALPILFGDNIGTCVTALLSSIGTNKNAKRAALIHLTFNTIGTIIFMSAFTLVLKFIPLLGGGIQRQIANSHTLFNITNVIIQAPFIPLLVKFVNKLVPGKDSSEDLMEVKYLDERLLQTPSIAFGQVLKEVVRMGLLASENLNIAMNSFLNKDEKKLELVYKNEKIINYLEDEITKYMITLSNTEISEYQAEKITSIYHIINDLERVGDHAENIGELAIYEINNQLNFSGEAIKELLELYKLTRQALDKSVHSLETSDNNLAKSVLDIESTIDDLEKRYKLEHIKRLNNYECKPESSTAYLELLTNLERVGDHSTNIAEIVIQWK